MFDIGAVDDLLTSAARRPSIRVVENGSRVDPSAYTSRLRIGGREVDGVADPIRVGQRFTAGATIVLQSLHRTTPSVSTFCGVLEGELDHPVQANAYLTPPRATGLAPHQDGHDVIVLQLHGSKQWEVDGIESTVELSAGSVLYVPAGTRHSARAGGSAASLHLTIGIIRTTYRDILRRVLADAGGVLDAPLPIGFTASGDRLTAGIATAVSAAAAHLQTADVDAIAESERSRRAPRIPRRGHLSSLVSVGDLDGCSVVRVRDGRPPTAESDGDSVLLDLGDGSALRLPSVADAAVCALLTGRPIVVGDLPGLDAESRLVLVRRLVVEGALVVDSEPRTASTEQTTPGGLSRPS